jgi:hypothetical protein
MEIFIQELITGAGFGIKMWKIISGFPGLWHPLIINQHLYHGTIP